MDMMVRPLDMTVRPRGVQEQAADRLRDAILAGYFKPGERLVEASLCRLLNVSRPSTREALRKLEGEQLVHIIPNKGPYVVKLGWEEARGIYEVREILEPEAAFRFTSRATPSDIAKIELVLQEFEAANANADVIGKLRATDHFYQTMLAGCGNLIIPEIFSGLMTRITFLRSHSMSTSDRSRYSLRELRDMSEAIKARDPERARRSALAHVKAAAAAAFEAFGRAEPRQV